MERHRPDPMDGSLLMRAFLTAVAAIALLAALVASINMASAQVPAECMNIEAMTPQCREAIIRRQEEETDRIVKQREAYKKRQRDTYDRIKDMPIPADANYLRALKQQAAKDPVWASSVEAELEILAKLDPEAVAIRIQYKNWMHESNLWQPDTVLIRDLESAVNLVAYNKHCALINESKLHRAETFLKAFPEYYEPATTSSMFGRLSYWNGDNYAQFCRWMNPTPKPVL